MAPRVEYPAEWAVKIRLSQNHSLAGLFQETLGAVVDE